MFPYVSILFLFHELESQDNGVYIPPLFPSFVSNKVNVGPLLSHNE